MENEVPNASTWCEFHFRKSVWKHSWSCPSWQFLCSVVSVNTEPVLWEKWAIIVSRSLKQDLCQPIYIQVTVFLFRVSTFDFRIAFKLQSSQQHNPVLAHKPLLKTSAKFRDNLKQLKLLVTKFWRQRKVTTTFVNFNKLNQAPGTGYEMAFLDHNIYPFLVISSFVPFKSCSLITIGKTHFALADQLETPN